jgi:hypothetical protein
MHQYRVLGKLCFPILAVIAACGGGNEDPTVSTVQKEQETRMQATAMSSGCSSFYAARPNFALTESLALDNILALTKPILGIITQEPNFNTCLVRASNYTLLPLAGGQQSTFARSDYSRRQAFNSDGTRYLIYESRGNWNVFNTATRAFVKRLNGPAGDAEVQWDATNPDLLYYIGGSPQNKLYSHLVSTNISTLVRDMAADITVWPGTTTATTGAEGSPSADGRYWCFMATNSSKQVKGLFVYDKTTNTIVGRTAWNDVEPNNVSMSPSGRWCVVQTNANNYSHTRAYSRDFSSQKLLDPAIGHADVAVAANGNDAFVGSNNSNTLFMVDLETGQRTNLMNFDVPGQGTTTAYHVSGKAYDKPGWVLVSTYFNRGPNNADDTGVRNWTHRKIFALQLKAAPAVRNIAFYRGNHPVTNNYFAEPHATVSRDFTKMLFNSNWYSSNLDIDAYMIEIPDASIYAGAAGELNVKLQQATLSNYQGSLQVQTSVPATCRFDAIAGKPFASMTETTTATGGGTVHTRTAFSLSATVDTQLYLGCRSNSTSKVVEVPVIFQVAPTGTQTVTVHASGAPAAGAWPTMELRVNGQLVQTQTVGSSSVLPYVFTVPTMRASDRIDVIFTNDATIGAEDRNIFVQSVTTPNGTISSLDPGVILDQGTGVAATDGVSTYPASQFGGWIPWNGSMRFVNPISGTSTVIVRARSTLVGGIGAQMQVFHKGAMIGSLRIDSTQMQNYRFSTTAVALGDRVDIVYTNDASASGEDRNLIVESVIVGSYTLLPTAANATFDQGDGIYAFDGVSVQPAAPTGGWIPWNAALRLFVQ